MKYKLLVSLCIILALLFTGVSVYAIYGKSVTSHVKVIQSGGGGGGGNVLLEFYQDENCTQVCNLVEWGDVTQGALQTRDNMFYVKNIGTLSTIITGTHSLPVGVGTFTVQFKQANNWVVSRSLNIGQSCGTQGVITILQTSPLGDCSFNIIVEGQ